MMTARKRMHSVSRGLLAATLVLVGACGDISSEANPDAPINDATAARCAPTAPFGTPKLVPGVNLNTATAEFNPRLTVDELGLYFARTANSWDIYFATRAQVSDDFGVPMPVAGVNSVNNELSPTVTANGLTMYMDLNSDIFVSSRANLSVDFSAPAPVSAVNTTDTERAAYILPSGRALYFSRFGPITGPREKIYRAEIGLTGVGTPIEVPGLGMVESPALPVVAPDELTIYFTARSDIWMATRTRPTDPFGTLTPITELNGATSGEESGWISSDGCVFYFASNRAGSGDLYVAERGR